MEKVLFLSINAPLLKSMAKLPKFAKDVINNRKELEKAFTRSTKAPKHKDDI